jgi:glycosyltransferase involved in cell wall biosynthesis
VTTLRILWLKTELLHPVDKGGKIRTYNMLKELARDHRITYLTLDDGTASASDRTAAREYCHELVCIPHRHRDKFTPGFYADLTMNLFSRYPYAVKKYESPEMRREVEERVNAGAVDVVVCDFLAPALNVPANLECGTVLFQHNVEAMIWKRHCEVQRNPLKKAYLRGQWVKMRDLEEQACHRFDQVIAVSAEDREQMKQDYRVDSVSDVPTGVDTEFFRPSGEEIVNPHGLVFTGSMDWLPNEDGIRYFVDEILPLIKQRIPDVTLTVVGRNPYPSLVELSKSNDSIVVTGRVDDVRPFMERAAVYIVPLRVGGGTRLKIFEAMAMERAIVSTTIGAEGLPIKHGEELIVEDTPEGFANSVVRLFQDQDLARQLGERAANKVRSTFGWGPVAERFAELCETTLNKPAVPAPMADERVLVSR